MRPEIGKTYVTMLWGQKDFRRVLDVYEGDGGLEVSYGFWAGGCWHNKDNWCRLDYWKVLGFRLATEAELAERET